MSDIENRNQPAAAQAAISGNAEPAQDKSANELEELRKEIAEVHAVLKHYQERGNAPTPPVYTAEELRKREYVRDSKPLLTREQAINTVGPLAWKKMSVEQRVAAQGFSSQDVAEHNIEKYFGPKSNSGAANRLAISNPALYKVLKAKAKEEGLI